MEAIGDCLGECWTQTATRVCSAAFLEVWVLACLFGGDATSWIIHEHHFKEVETVVVEVDAERGMLIPLPFGERALEIGEAGLVGDARPFLFGWGT